MMVTRICLSIFALLALWLALADGAPQANQGAASLITQLLSQPAPPPPLLPVVAEALAKQRQAYEKRAANPAAKPGADAKPEEVLRYWDSQVQFETLQPASEQERWQFLEACVSGKDFYSRALAYLPDTPAAHERIHAFLQEADPPRLTAQAAAQRKQAKESLRVWLRRHSGYFRDELLQAASQAKLDGRDLRGGNDLAALATLDWAKAAPLIEPLLSHPEPALRTLALRLSYLHALATQSPQTDEWRWQLRKLVTDPQTPREARTMAFETLVEQDWPGLEEWFAALFAEENLLKGKNLLSDDTLARPVKNQPAKWNPLLSQLVASGNRTIHNNAVLCLATVALRKPNREALLPLLPWLSDPKWTAAGDEYTRYRVIEGAGALQLPEALPGLLAILRNEKEFARVQAVEALAKYRSPESAPRITQALREAVRQETFDYSLLEMTKLLVALGGLTNAEKLAALEALVTEADLAFSDSFGQRWLQVQRDQVNTRQAIIGLVLLDQQASHSRLFSPGEGSGKLSEDAQAPFSAAVAAGLIERSKALRAEKPLVAQRLWLIAQCLDFPAVAVALGEQLAAGLADLDTVLIALERRSGLAQHASQSLNAMRLKGGPWAGIGAVLLDDPAKSQMILQGQDSAAQAALLAVARLVRAPLPLEFVSQLYATNEPLLKLAAERYLESEDSPAARRQIHEQHANEALILGARENFDPSPKYALEWNNWENALRDEVRQGRASEIIGLFSMTTSDSGPPEYANLEVRLRGESAELCRRKDKARQECRPLSAAEWQAARDLFTAVNFDDLTPLPLPGGGFGGTAQEIVRITKTGGRRVYASNLSLLRWRNDYAPAAPTPHETLIQALHKLTEAGTFEIRYALKEKIKNLEVLAADDAQPITSVCGQGGEIRVLVENAQRRYQENPKWHVLQQGRVGAGTQQPDACPSVDDKTDMPEKMRDIRFGYEPPLWQIKTKDGVVRERTWNEESGLWLCLAGQDPKLLLPGYASRRLVTPDGRWLLVDKSTREKQALLKIEIPSGQTTEFKLEGVGSFLTVEPFSGRILFAPADWKNPAFGLYQPATGQLELVKGDFAPLQQQHTRALQRVAGSMHEFWAALPESENKRTRVGRYDAKSFKFTTLLELPEITFTSMQMWVDEAARQLYLAYNGHLLRLPFAPPRQ